MPLAQPNPASLQPANQWPLSQSLQTKTSFKSWVKKTSQCQMPAKPVKSERPHQPTSRQKYCRCTTELTRKNLRSEVWAISLSLTRTRCRNCNNSVCSRGSEMARISRHQIGSSQSSSRQTTSSEKRKRCGGVQTYRQKSKNKKRRKLRLNEVDTSKLLKFWSKRTVRRWIPRMEASLLFATAAPRWKISAK